MEEINATRYRNVGNRQFKEAGASAMRLKNDVSERIVASGVFLFLFLGVSVDFQ